MVDYYIDEDTLAHYGVKGMKWGVRRSESRASGSGSGLEGRRKKLSSRTKKILAVSAGIAVAAGAAYAGTRVVKAQNLKNFNKAYSTLERKSQYLGRELLKEKGFGLTRGTMSSQMNDYNNRQYMNNVDTLVRQSPRRTKNGKVRMSSGDAAKLRLRLAENAVINGKSIGLSGDDLYRYEKEAQSYFMDNIHVDKPRKRRRR